jgi:hypothetical protein
MRLTPPTKIVFFLSVALAGLAFLLYLLSMAGVIGGGFASIGIFAFWLGLIAWAMLAVGVALKGV